MQLLWAFGGKHVVPAICPVRLTRHSKDRHDNVWLRTLSHSLRPVCFSVSPNPPPPVRMPAGLTLGPPRQMSLPVAGERSSRPWNWVSPQSLHSLPVFGLTRIAIPQSYFAVAPNSAGLNDRTSLSDNGWLNFRQHAVVTLERPAFFADCLAVPIAHRYRLRLG